MSKSILEYVWLDAQHKFRSKIKVVQDISEYDYFQEWNYDGSSTAHKIHKYCNQQVILTHI